ncbi:uncharacterized protein LOC131019010 [Salvia miltiorrhiza]|uniref:uncharacterized protein LOC131019010 n=1 Tax=Salvia miltiorrhiza TaxID=226208 RepID=UPI0025AD4000|nr:uncharacterized protein LOC131019010 [Salvia miltiorrhiza]
MPPRRGRTARRNANNDRNQNDEPEVPRNDREPTPPPPPPARRIEELFLRQNPPTFNGMGDPAEAEAWVRALERIFTFLRCTEEERLSCVSFQLTGAADFWWEARRKTLTPEQWAAYTWENFKTGLYDKYIPKSYRKKKEAEFYNLRQGKRTVMEYDREFSSHGGLSYTESLNRALDVEAAMPVERLAPPQTSAPANLPVRPQNFKGKRNWNNQGGSENPTNKKPWQGGAPSWQGGAPSWQGSAPFGQFQPQGQGKQKGLAPAGGNQRQNEVPPCPKCNKPHRGVCRAGTDGCYTCGQKGHYSSQCPNRQQGAAIRATYAQPLRAVPGQQQPRQQ